MLQKLFFLALTSNSLTRCIFTIWTSRNLGDFAWPIDVRKTQHMQSPNETSVVIHSVCPCRRDWIFHQFRKTMLFCKNFLPSQTLFCCFLSHARVFYIESRQFHIQMALSNRRNWVLEFSFQFYWSSLCKRSYKAFTYTFVSKLTLINEMPIASLLIFPFRDRQIPLIN